MHRPWLILWSVAASLGGRDAHAQAQSDTRAAEAYQAALAAGPPTLQIFLSTFPKGADLHVHLDGAVYAETFIRDAADDGWCIDPAALKVEQPPCAAPLVPAASLSGVLNNAQQSLYDRLVDAFSMRNFVPTSARSGHDQFFASFGRFAMLRGHEGEWVEELAERAAAQNEQYLELMDTPPFAHAATLASKHSFNPDFAAYRQVLL